MRLVVVCALAAGCVASEPQRPDVEAYSSPSAIETGGGARIALEQHEDSSAGAIVVARLDFATGTVTPLSTVNGARGEPALAGNDSRAYLTWFADGHSYGAVLGDGLGAMFELCADCTVRPYAVGARFLVVEHSVGRQDARWIEADGSVGAAFPFPGEVKRVGGTSVGAGFGVTMVRRNNNTYALVRTDGVEIPLADVADMWSVAVLPDGTVLATWGTVTEGRVTRVAPDGTVTTRASNGQCLPKIIVAADRVFGVCGLLLGNGFDIIAFKLDVNGAFLDDGTVIIDDAPPFDTLDKTPMFAIGRDLLVFDRSSWPEATHFDGDVVAAPVRIAGGNMPR